MSISPVGMLQCEIERSFCEKYNIAKYRLSQQGFLLHLNEAWWRVSRELRTPAAEQPAVYDRHGA